MRKIAFLGSKALGLSVLNSIHTPDDEWLLIHPDDQGDGRSVLSDFRIFAQAKDLDLLIAGTQSAADAMLGDFKPDVVFVCGWYWILKPEVLDLAPLGFWGIHNSLLPKYRGASPLVWAIANGEKEVGSTVFCFSEGVDDGPILLQVSVAVEPNDHIADVLDRIETALLAELPSKWSALLRGHANLVEQDDSEATYAGQRTPDDGRIDWTRPATEVHDFIRAQSPPYPGAFTYVDGNKVTITRSEIDARQWFGTPGQVLQRTSEHVVMACGGNTALRVTAVDADLAPKTVFRSIALRAA